MAKRRKKRSAFPADDRPKMPEPKETYISDEPISGVFGFFRDFGTRETIESIVVAIILALMFRAYEVEAFIIPTGSMAPSLQGEHKDLNCDSCGFRYRAGASSENAVDPANYDFITHTYCPICQFKTRIRKTEPNHVSNNGDRILVNKFIYDFAEPQRYDVIVFKNPNNGKQNYIKRLIGLPGDNILIENGDIYLLSKNEQGGWDRKISRKPAHKLRHVLQVVDDTKFISADLKNLGWPMRWNEDGNKNNWEMVENNSSPTFITKANPQTNWLRYRHLRPSKSEWPTLEAGSLPEKYRDSMPAGQLIADNYGYNDGHYSRMQNGQTADQGLHWVGDIGMHAEVDVQSASGTIMLDLVEGGAHFQCSIDVSTGEATLSCQDSDVKFQTESGQEVASPKGLTRLRGAGKYRIEYVNADDQIHLWINNRYVKFDAASYLRDEYVVPKFSEEDPGDAEPAGIAVVNLAARITRLKIVRDIYYTSVRSEGNISSETDYDPRSIRMFFNSPELWSKPEVVQFFKLKKMQTEPMFELQKCEAREKDQFLPMGDNSPHSLDGRVWGGPKYVERDLLIGRALFIYWPHTLNEPIPFFPNFGGMGFIR